MTYKRYTHDIVIKNSKEFLYNAFIEHKIGDTTLSSTGVNQEKTTSTKNKKRTIAIPGLINLHCHLVHTDQNIPSQNLFPWLKELVQKNQNINHMGEVKALKKAALAGAHEALSFGTTYLVDNTHNLKASYSALKETGLRGLIGLEIFGSDPEMANVIMNEARNLMHKILRYAQDNIQVCLSPHAAYDVSPELWKLILDYSKKNNLKVLSHIAESKAEEAWFKDKDADEAKEAKEFWQSINTLDTKFKHWRAYKSSVDFLKENNLLDPCLLLAHAVHCSKEDLLNLQKNKVNLITCPRSNLYLNNGLPAYQAWEELGILYGLGTDSKASNQDLDLRKELEKISLNPERKFELVTSDAAKILGLDDEIGKLDEAMQADWVVLEILDDSLNLQNINPYELALNTKLTKVKEVWIKSKLASDLKH